MNPISPDDSTLEVASGLMQAKDEGIGAAKITNRTRKRFVHATQGYNFTDSTAIFLATVTCALTFPDLKRCWGLAMGYVPADFVSGLTVSAVIQKAPNAGGDVYCILNGSYETCDEVFDTHNFDTGYQAVAIPAGVNYVDCIQSTALAAAVAGDFLHLAWERNGADVLDTIGGFVVFYGFLLEYTADS